LHRSFRAYQLAAEEGSVHAMRNLAAMHFAGEGCEANEATARYMLRIAKEAEAAQQK
jgi:TPR repeat protein